MKICVKCDKELDDLEFAWKNSKKNIRHNICKKCVKVYTKAHYQSNKDEYKQRARRDSKKNFYRNRELLLEYLHSHPCVDCGNNNPLVLHFDHLKDKKYNISRMMGTYSWNTVLKEIEKCEVRCANCHMIKTAEKIGSFKFKAGMTKLAARPSLKN